MNKSLIIVIVALVLIVGIYIFNKNSVPTNVEQANISENATTTAGEKISLDQVPPVKNFSFTFTGYGPAGKFHDGTFKEIILATSSVVFKSATVSTGIEGLDTHLCAAEFFDCLTYSDIIFVANSLTKKTDTSYEVIGTLSFKNITKQVIFNANKEGNNVSADFLLDTTEFNFNPALVENDVRVKFSFEI